MEDLELQNNVFIPASSVKFKFSRSGGKGGQHVNKVSTKVEASVNIDDVIAPADTLTRIKRRLAGMLDKEGVLHVVSQESRSQWQNKRLAVDKIVEIIDRGSRIEKQRRATAPSRSSKLKRLISKKKMSDRKSLRKRVAPDDR
jgi:ribosome-associated protein